MERRRSFHGSHPMAYGTFSIDLLIGSSAIIRVMYDLLRGGDRLVALREMSFFDIPQ